MAKILSIEIGYSLTRICEMDYRVKSPKIYKYVSIPTPQGIVEDGFLSDNEEFAAEVRRVLAEKHIKTKQAVFSVTSSKIATREVTVPAIKTNQIEALVKANASDYFPIDLTEYELAHLILGVIKGEEKADKYKVMVMAAGKNLVAGYERFAGQCGLHLISLDYSGNSIYQIMRNECEEDAEMIIKVEERSTIATVISDQMLVLQRNIVYGVDDAVQTLVRTGVFEEKSYRDALELMKRKTCIKVVLSENTKVLEADETLDDERIAAAKKEIAGALSPLISNVARVADLYNSKNPERPVKKIRLVGLGGDISGLSKLFTNELGIKTVVLNDLKSIVWNRAGGEGNPGRYIAGIGAAYDPVGFINEEKKKSDIKNVNYKNAAVLLGIFFAVASAALCMFAMTRYNEVMTEQKRLQRLEAEYLPAEAVYNTYNNMSAFYKEVENGYKQTEHPNDNLLAFMEELEEKLPADAELTDFVSDDKQAVLTMKVINKEEAAKVIQTLRDFDSVMDVSIGALDKEDIDEAASEEGDPRVLFSLVCSYYTLTIDEPAATPAAAE